MTWQARLVLDLFAMWIGVALVGLALRWLAGKLL